MGAVAVGLGVLSGLWVGGIVASGLLLFPSLQSTLGILAGISSLLRGSRR